MIDIAKLKHAAEKIGAPEIKNLHDYLDHVSPSNILSLISRLERAEAKGRNQGIDEAAKVAADFITADPLVRIILKLKTTEGET